MCGLRLRHFVCPRLFDSWIKVSQAMSGVRGSLWQQAWNKQFKQYQIQSKNEWRADTFSTAKTKGFFTTNTNQLIPLREIIAFHWMIHNMNVNTQLRQTCVTTRPQRDKEKVCVLAVHLATWYNDTSWGQFHIRLNSLPAVFLYTT